MKKTEKSSDYTPLKEYFYEFEIIFCITFLTDVLDGLLHGGNAQPFFFCNLLLCQPV